MPTSLEVKAGMKSSLRSHVRILTACGFGSLLSAVSVGRSARFVMYCMVCKPFVL